MREKIFKLYLKAFSKIPSWCSLMMVSYKQLKQVTLLNIGNDEALKKTVQAPTLFTRNHSLVHISPVEQWQSLLQAERRSQILGGPVPGSLIAS